MYLTNSERIELGLVGYGSDVPDDVVAAAREKLKPTRRRARNGKGQLVADDPTTAANEAWEES